MTNEFLPPSLDEMIAGIDWENMSVEELMQILDQLGIGFYETLSILLSKLSPSQKGKLMILVKQSQLGNKASINTTKRQVLSIKKDDSLETLLKHIITLLDWRAEKKNIADELGGFGKFKNIQFQPQSQI
jgi:hypothetical protein